MSYQLREPPNRRRAVVVLAAGSYLNNAILIIQGLLLIPLYLHFIGERMYGLWLATGGILAWLGFLDLGLAGLLIQRISSAYGRRDFKQAAEYFVNGVVVYGLLVFIFCLTILGLSIFLPDWLSAEGQEIPLLRACFQLAGIAASAELLNNCLRSFSQALQRPLFPMACMIFFRILGLIAIVVLLFKDYHLWAIPIGLLINSIPVLLLNFHYCVILILQLGEKWTINKKVILDYFRLSPAMLSGKMGYSLVTNIEPTIIAVISRPELAPAFIITKRVADIIVQLIQVVNSSIFPSFSHLYAEGDFEKFRRFLTRILILCFSVGLVGFGTYLAANRAFVQLWVDPKQFLGNEVTLLIALGSFMFVINLYITRFLIGIGDFVYPSLMIFFEAVIRVALMTILLHKIGILGLPLGTAVSCVVFGGICYKRLEKQLQLSIIEDLGWLRPTLLLAAVFSLGYLASLNIPNLNSWFSLGGYVCLVFLFLSIINWMFIPALKEYAVLLSPLLSFRHKAS